MHNIPVEFLDKMKLLLGSEYDKFLSSYEIEKSCGLRVNTLKIGLDDFLSISRLQLEQIPWAKTGFYYNPAQRPGKHLYHECGLYYIQEPSAMAVAELLDPQPGERVLDLCAAPGGKSTQLAAKLQGQGLLVSNEINPARAKILSQNIERMGISNCIVTNESPDSLSGKLACFFDRILVDAPCSGEGMFKKEEQAIEHWSQENVEFCSQRQLEILRSASMMLKPGGVIVYSTCTFSPEENEMVIEKFIAENPDFEIAKPSTAYDFDHGNPQWGESKLASLSNSVRLWPHRLRGEGHFAAILKNKNSPGACHVKNDNPEPDKNAVKLFNEFKSSHELNIPEGTLTMLGDNLYLLPPKAPELKKLKLLRPGLHLGTVKKSRFEPSHSLALHLGKSDFSQRIALKSDSSEAFAFVKGETLSLDALSGWNLVLIDGFSIGWGKYSNGMLKNHYPKGLRVNLQPSS